MIKVEYVLDGTKGELELTKLTSFDSKEEILVAHGGVSASDALAEYLLEDVMAVLRPEVEVASNMYNCQRGGERNKVTTRDDAENLGFTKLVGKFDGQTIVVC